MVREGDEGERIGAEAGDEGESGADE